MTGAKISAKHCGSRLMLRADGLRGPWAMLGLSGDVRQDVLFTRVGIRFDRPTSQWMQLIHELSFQFLLWFDAYTVNATWGIDKSEYLVPWLSQVPAWNRVESPPRGDSPRLMVEGCSSSKGRRVPRVEDGSGCWNRDICWNVLKSC